VIGKPTKKVVVPAKPAVHAAAVKPRTLIADATKKRIF